MTVTITPTRDLDACFALRREVFMREQGFSQAEEFDGKTGKYEAYFSVEPGSGD